MSIELVIELAWKSLAVAALALIALRLLRRRSAAERALVAHLGIAAILLLPLAAWLVPELRFAAPPAVAEAYQAVAPATTAEATVAARADPAVADPPPTMRWLDMAAYAYLLPAALLLMLTLTALLRLHRLRRRAEVVVDPRWLTALAAAQSRLHMRHGTALLASDEVASPISWGVVRPIIVLDRKVAADAAGAEAIIAHELAHVARLDWLGLLLGRLACALCWFNPLVWLLARRAHQLSEQAADDAVLRSRVPSSDYAELLVASARHAAPPLALAANGVAPSRDSLRERVVAVLDSGRARAPVRFGWGLLCAAAAVGLGSAVAATTPKLVAETHWRTNLADAAPPRSPASLALAEALIEAAERGDVAAMAELIDAGASPDSALRGDGTPLIAAARAGRSDAVAFLLDRGADLNLGVRGDGNPLIAAAGAGRTDIVRLLLDRGADIEAAVPEDENALITASRRGRAEVVRLLVARGADVNRELNGRTPLAMARAGGHEAIAALLAGAGAMR